MSKPANEMEWLMDVFSQDRPLTAPENVEKIKLSQMISQLGFFYEKFRNAIDYKEEHLIRRDSVERLLKRQILFLKERQPEKISKNLIYEFIRAKYLPNDTLPETIINELAVTIEKYLAIFSYFHKHQLPGAGQLTDWFMSVASCEINEQLNPIGKDLAVANLMYSRLVDNLVFAKTKIPEKERNLQLYIAVLKTFLKADPASLRYYLLKLYLPQWQRLSAQEVLEQAAKLPPTKNNIDLNLKHPIGFQLARVIRPQAVFFSLLRELLEKNKKNLRPLLDNPDSLEEEIELIASDNYQKIKSKLIGTILRVILYILLTKTILAFALELPYDCFFLHEINWRALTINVVFHPLLMFLIASAIRVPGEKNTKIIVQEIKKVVYGEKAKIVFKQRTSLERGSASYFVFNAIYLIMFLISFGLIMMALHYLHFNVLSGLLFVFFLTLVSFFGFRLRNFAKQLSVMPRKDNLSNFIFDFLSLPIIRVGRFFSSNFSKINIFVYLLDFIIETPFKALVEFLEKTVSFINEKREEIVEE